MLLYDANPQFQQLMQTRVLIYLRIQPGVFPWPWNSSLRFFDRLCYLGNCSFMLLHQFIHVLLVLLHARLLVVLLPLQTADLLLQLEHQEKHTHTHTRACRVQQAVARFIHELLNMINMFIRRLGCHISGIESNSPRAQPRWRFWQQDETICK